MENENQEYMIVKWISEFEDFVEVLDKLVQ